MSLRIERLNDVASDHVADLLADSERAGSRIVRRLVEEWGNATNRFDRPGEALFGAWLDGLLVGVCGLTVDPHAGNERVGRVRHLYVSSAVRRHGVGRQLVRRVIATAHGRFQELRLRTNNLAAVRLYEALGFTPGPGSGNYTHVAPLTLAETTEESLGHTAINFRDKFGLFTEQWQPKVIAELNDYQFKLVKLQGDFIWHDHKDTDEAFIVVEGNLRIDFRDGAVHVSTGEMFVVPKGVEHKPYAEQEVKLLLIEPRGVLNTGHEGGERTARNDVWI